MFSSDWKYPLIYIHCRLYMCMYVPYMYSCIKPILLPFINHASSKLSGGCRFVLLWTFKFMYNEKPWWINFTLFSCRVKMIDNNSHLQTFLQANTPIVKLCPPAGCLTPFYSASCTHIPVLIFSLQFLIRLWYFVKYVLLKLKSDSYGKSSSSVFFSLNDSL